MTLLRTFKPHSDPNLLGWVQDVDRALTAQKGGLSWADNVGPVITLRYLAANAPIAKQLPSNVRTKPLSVFVLRAENRTDQTYESGNRIVWSFDGDAIVIRAIDVSDTNDSYEVTLGLLMG